MIVFVLYFIQCLFLGTSIVIFLKNMTNKKEKTVISKQIMLLIICLLLTINHIYFPMIIKLPVLVLTYFIVNKYILNFDYKTSIFYMVIIIIYLSLGDMLISFRVTNILENQSIEIYRIYTLIYTITSSLFLIFISKLKIFRTIIETIKKSYYTVKKEKLIYVLVSFEILIYIILSLLIFNYSMNKMSDLLLVLLYFSSSIIICVSQIIIYVNMKTKKYREELTNINKFYIEKINEDKIFKHNINNQLLSIKSISCKKVGKLIDNILYKENQKLDKMIQLGNLPKGFVTLFYDKLRDNHNITINIVNKIIDDEKNYIKYVSSLGLPLCTCLDNIIEISKELEKVEIAVFFEEDSENLTVKISNNFINELDLDKLGLKNYSTKNRKSGFGLYSIKKSNKVKSKIEIINDIFTLYLTIKK